MNRRDKLLELRQIVSTMQREISTLQQANLQATTKDQHISSKHLYSHSKSPSSNRKSVHSPLQLQEYSPSTLNRWKQQQEATKKSIEKYQTIAHSIDTRYYSRCQRKQSHPPRQPLFNIATKVDQRFYLLADKQQENKENRQRTIERSLQQNEEGTKGYEKRKRTKIFQANNLKQSRNTELQSTCERQELATYRGSSSFLSPQSNPYLKFYGEKGIVSKGKEYLSSRRNRSLIFGGSTLLQISNSCSKRHYNRYFAEHYNSCLS